MMALYQQLDKLLSRMIIGMIGFYQKTLSPDHSPLAHRFPYGYCRFRPTCSEYSIQAYQKYGLFKGTFLSAIRVIKCNPFNKGGEDPLK